MANFETQLLLNLNELEFDTSEELTVESIKSHYKKLSLYYHPDLNNNEIFRDKQKKINSAKTFLLENLDEVNRYIRRVNYKETAEDKARRQQEEKAEQERQAQRNRAQEEAERAKREKERAEERARQEARTAEANRKAAEEAAARERAEAALRAEREQANAKKKRTKLIIITIVIAVIGIPLFVGIVNAFITGFNEGMESDRQAEQAQQKEDRTKNITDTNLPSTLIKGAEINWSDYYVTYKNDNGEETKVTLSADMLSIDYENFEEQKIEINVGNGEVYLYHKLTVLKSNTVSSLSDLKSIANDPNGTYILNTDIDLSGAEWTPIESFEGTLLGGGHTIKGLTITSFSTKNIGLFGTVGEKAKISDLTLENVSISSSGTADCIGALAGCLTGKIENISVSGKIEAIGSNCVGGIAGMLQSQEVTLENCSFNGTVTGSEGVGGIVGGKEDEGYGIIDKCTASGSISGTSAVGGIAGKLSSSNAKTYKVSDCKNDAAVTAMVEYCGGIIGKLKNSTTWGVQSTSITNCTNNGAISGGAYTAGIVGYMHIAGGYTKDATLDGNTNTGSITGKNYTAGIVGFNDFTTTMKNGTNSGKIKGEAYTAGFVGYGNYTSGNGLNNSATIDGAYYVGGIMGQGDNCTNCHNTGNISATLYDTKTQLTAVGGIGGLLDEADGCTNSGAIKTVSGYAIGGITGGSSSNYDDGKFTNCKNSGAISVSNVAKGVGGIVGYFVKSSRDIKLSISGCENTGDISVLTGEFIGGILGYFRGNDLLTVISCKVNSQITATECSSVGGIVGCHGNSKGYNAAKIETLSFDGSISGKQAVGSIIGSIAKEPANYESIKVTYVVGNSVSQKHIGKITG